MGRESFAFFTGLFVVLLGASLVAAAIWLGNLGNERDTYLVSTQQAVSGLNPESTVFYRGVAIGKVRAIHFDPTDVRTILIRIDVDKNAPITRGTWAMLRVQPLTGLTQVELNDAGEDTAPLPTSAENPARIRMRPSLFEQVTASGQDILGQLSQLASRLNLLLDEENLARLKHILADTDRAIGQMNRSLAELPGVATEARQTLARIGEVTGDLRTTTRQVEKLAETTRELAASGKLAGETLGTATLPQMNALMQDLQFTSTRLRQLATALERDPRSLLLGPSAPSPGPGEPGYREPSP
jgi:phospholipid/cholesterol/gamma-HCH transport system substrate-binding protein